MTRQIALVTDSYPAVPGLDTTLARALLRAVSENQLGETFRIYSPGRVLAFGKRDSIESGFAEAAAAAAGLGYTPLVRLAGGRAAVFHENTLAFGWTMPIEDPRAGIQARFEQLAELMVGAFDRLGITSSVGEIPGEYCPGRFSVHNSMQRKVMGVGQRLARNAAHVGGVIVVDDAPAVNEVLLPVYGELGVDFDPAATGALSDTAPGIASGAVVAAIVAELARFAELQSATLDRTTLHAGRALLADHLVDSAVPAAEDDAATL